ncbi:MAG TPA: M14 metallopeptidase family protein [Longimicrobiales bacterium]|nr:M14 metallopeptidase family protein [Longimicrobiales bacterium]
MRSLRHAIAALSLVLVATPLWAQTAPAPASVLGFEPGADFRLATYEQSVDYFQKLDAASDRVQMLRVGKTSFGRDWYVVVVSSPENLADLDHYRDIARRIADPQSLTDAQALALAREGKAVVDISGGLHASEVAGAQHIIALGYELATSDEPRIRAIRDNVITVLWPSLNPDGQTLVADWYAGNVGTPYEVSSMPWLYQKYVGHDNNRDAYMLNMIESRVVERVWRDWEPQIIHVHHQSSPFPTRIWLPPFAEPIAPRAPALMSRTVNTIGMAMAQLLESRGLPGATHMGTGFDAWYPGYIDYLPVLQNQAAFWTETALYRYATPHFYTLSDFPSDMRDLRAQTLYPSPWTGGWWRLADAVEYMHVASIAVLDYAAKYREDLLYNRYQSGRDVVARYTAGPPYAYFVKQDQRDPVAPVELLRRLAYNGIRVSQLTSSVTHEGLDYPVGTWVVPMDQPFAELARQVLEVQEYPDLREYPEGPPEQPYDAAGWTLPSQMGVNVVAATQPLSPDTRSAMQPLSGEALPWDAEVVDASPFDAAPGAGFDDHAVAAAIKPLPGRMSGSGAALLLDPAQNNAYKALNAAWDAGASVRYASAQGGRYVVTGLEDGTARRLVEDLALRAARGPATGTPLPRPRIGLYRPWTASMDEGWTRWLLERYGFAFTSVYDADARTGGLEDRYDVLILPAERVGSLKDGFAKGSVPDRYAGGMGAEGIRALAAFVEAGGTLVCMNQASDLCINELHLPVTNVVGPLRRNDFFGSGTILRVQADTGHPVMAGMPGQADVFFDRSPVFDTAEGFDGAILAFYADAGSPLVSGYLLGEEHLQGKAAAVDVRHGQGHVILLGFRPQWRGQPWGSFRVLFNSVLFHGDVARAAPGSEDTR